MRKVEERVYRVPPTLVWGWFVWNVAFSGDDGCKIEKAGILAAK